MDEAKGKFDRKGERGEKTSPRVLVLHNGSLYAEVVAELLRKQCRLDVTQATATNRTAPAQVRRSAPDLLIVDNQDARLNAHALLLRLLHEHPGLHVLCLTMEGNCSLQCPARVRRVTTKEELLDAVAACKACVHDADQANASQPD